MNILCPKCHIGRVDSGRCSRCGCKPTRAQTEQERTGRLLRNSLIVFVTLLTGVWLARLL